VVARGLGEAAHAADLLDEALEYGEKTGHPLLIGMARTLRGFVALEQGDGPAAEVHARVALAVVEPHDVFEPAQVAPRLLLAMARHRAGDHATALKLLAPIAANATVPALLVGRRQAVASYAAVLLATGRTAEALTWARRATEAPGEDLRSQVFTERVLAAALSAAERGGPPGLAAAERAAAPVPTAAALDPFPG
jgi:hypothetical protein